MSQFARQDRTVSQRWVRAILVIFLMMGLSFGTWLSRLPALRDELGATTLQMSIYGLCLAAGSLGGMVVAGRVIERFGARRVMAVAIVVQAVMLPAAVALFVAGALPLGLAVLFVYGLCFSTTDIAMNVSGALAERAYGKPRLPLMHAGYSIGVMVAMGVGALAESLQFTLQAHFAGVMLAIVVISLVMLRHVVDDEVRHEDHAAADSSTTPQGSQLLITTSPIPIIVASETEPDDLVTATGSIPIISQVSRESRVEPDRLELPGRVLGGKRYSPWRDRRVLLVGFITLSAGLLEGAPADWLPLALVDGRGVSNEFGAIMLGVFFGAVVTARLIGSALLTRFSRVTVLRGSFVLAIVGVLLVVLIPNVPGMIIGTLLWGLGTGVCWPITISAAADDPKTAARDVAAVSAIGYTSMLIGPMAFGVLGEQIGLLQAFWVLPFFAVVGLLLAGVARTKPPQS
ncbi:MAG: MFS transporter [Leucobacter sp.]|nr:MFS transporter [Leucobacter sp.]